MPIPDQSSELHGAPTITLLTAADLQDDLMIATNDLDRLQTLLSHACDELLQSFHGAIERMREYLEQPAAPLHKALVPDLCNGVMQQLGGAVTALQFQD